MTLDMTVRPMRTGDINAAEALTGSTFHALDVATNPADWPAPEARSDDRRSAWRDRCAHFLAYDAPGCWVAEDDEGLVGVATSLRRETMWMLSSFAVRGGAQGKGVGSRLLEAALAYSQGCVRGMIDASQDPRAVRRYHQAGFTIHPHMLVHGVVDRSRIPVVEHVRDGSLGDLDLMNSIDRQTRDAAHLVDHEFMAAEFALRVVDDSTGSGYVYILPSGGAYLLAATNRRTASRLLWDALAAVPEGEQVTVDHLTGEQDWAIDVAMEARLSVYQRGYLALRFMKPPAPYVPSPHFL
ncbi:GNAT family N-acetyltransferase [Solicola gregarius]|uniref:GNAT family N-acetyltransferase n=1 Tax=Solicola gregarius TaxID=2908642 RepID=A0AA46THG0_9ACTN|nr:GNAT family N-acetyltransferase [Solicola gregarius]UYM05424.1 GNAT family N-acetyltransferase [Solicola gregarius]